MEKEKQPTLVQEIVNYFFILKGGDNKDKSFYLKNKILYGRYTKPARDLLILCDNDLTKSKKYIKLLSEGATKNKLSGTLDTVIKRGNDFKDVEKDIEPYSQSQQYYDDQNDQFNKRYGKYLS